MGQEDQCREEAAGIQVDEHQRTGFSAWRHVPIDGLRIDGSRDTGRPHRPRGRLRSCTAGATDYGALLQFKFPQRRYAGFDGDYTQYPSDEEAGAFLRAYLAAEAGVAPAEISADAVADAVVEANLYALASHQYWGAWCFLQAQWSLLDFDYLEYARVRWAECAARSEAFLAAAAQRFPVQEGA